jgi:F-type H+-transporting ATPase subunit a
MHISLAAETIFYLGSFPVTNSLLASLVVTVLLLIITLVIRIALKNNPDGVQNAFEAIIEYLLNLSESIGGAKTRKFLPLVLTFFIYILFCNWISLLPGFGSIGFYKTINGTKEFLPLLRGSAADLNMTLALGLIAFFSIQYYGFSGQKLGYLKKFFDFSSPIMFFTGILELVSEFARIISFSFRLFGNIFAGEVLLSVMTFLIPVIIPVPFIGLELFVGLIQALVFALLTLVFINIAMTTHGEEVEHGIN